MDKKLIYEGSVKNIYELADSGNLVFSYTNKYSIFDWGEMPDQLDDKGKSLAIMGAGFFEFMQKYPWEKLPCPPTVSEAFYHQIKSSRSYESLCRRGPASHYIGHLKDNDQVAKALPTNNTLVVKKVDVHRPTWTGKSWDYWKYQHHPKNALVPLEVIFRFGIPSGSSFLSRAGDKHYLKSIGLSEVPDVGSWLPFPVIEFSTKLESTDRYLSYKEAQEISGTSDAEFAGLVEQAQLSALALYDFFANLKIELWDGKFEFSFGSEKEFPNRSFEMVDSIGPDELRLIANGIHLSKEFLRQAYRQSAWYEAIATAKKQANQANDTDWKKHCAIEPEHLSVSMRLKAENIYRHLANEISQKVWNEKPFNLNQSFSAFLDSLGER